MDVVKRLNEYSELVNEALDIYLPQPEGPQKNVIKAMRYSVEAGGKRIRPALTLEFCRLCGGTVEAAMPFACAIEMIHTYSLIHDDLPCMDNDDLRRGKPSCHKQFGEATALLAGDALLSLAFETALCDNGKNEVKQRDAITAVRMLAKASGAAGMVGGQMIDLESEGKHIGLETLEFMHRKKTGEMITASAKIGCIIAGADKQIVDAAEGYASRLGLAFQIVDDYLDVAGECVKTGKAIGSDKTNKKTTYITHLGPEKSLMLAKKLTMDAVSSLNGIEDHEFLTDLANFLVERDR